MTPAPPSLVDDPLVGFDARDLFPVPARHAWAALRLVLRDEYANAPTGDEDPSAPERLADHIDWDGTFALRQRVDRYGLGVAEAMDTAQRSRVGWDIARRLIEGTGRLALARPFVAGAGADQLVGQTSESALVDAVVEQASTIRAAGGIPMLLTLPALARASEETTVRVYRAILRQLEAPLLAHWLGPQFAPELAGAFPGQSFRRVMALEPDKLRGAKLSLLDPEQERSLRAELVPRGQLVLTGDDLHFGELIEGDEDGPITDHADLAGLRVPLGPFSHALLGVLDALARSAVAALDALARGDRETWRARIAPCEAFGRACFEPPVAAYTAGLAFVSWLDGRQSNALVVDHLERRRDRAHYLRLAELAAAAGALEDLPGARERLAAYARDSGAAG